MTRITAGMSAARRIAATAVTPAVLGILRRAVQGENRVWAARRRKAGGLIWFCDT
jgi:hypothetical protein